MKHALLYLLTFSAGSLVVAQQPVPYAELLERDTTIRWAAEQYSTVLLLPRVVSESLQRTYRGLRDKGKLKRWRIDRQVMAATPLADSAATLSEPVWVNNRVLYNQLRYTGDALFDSTLPAPLFYSGNGIVSDIEAFRVQQVVYYRKGQFVVENISVAPISRERGATGMECKTYFSTSFHVAGRSSKVKKSWRFLGTQYIHYNLHPQRQHRGDTARVLTWRNPDPILNIVADAQKGLFELHNLNSDHPERATAPADSFFTFYGNRDTVPVVDPNDPSVIVRFEIVTEKLSPDAFGSYGIQQSFYYDERNDRLYSVVHKVVIRKPVFYYSDRFRG
ncbi:MAG: hypothetical protein EOP50_17675, partial [Sphingobacteriales bacterium]